MKMEKNMTSPEVQTLATNPYSRTQKEALLTGCDHYTVCFSFKSEL